jgi:hypothetical protein
MSGKIFEPRWLMKILGISLILFQLYPVTSAQLNKEEAPPLRERIFYGGSFGLQFGTLTDIQISPVIGLWVLPRVAVAAGPDYRFYKYYTQKTQIYGGKTYAELTVLRNINSVIPIGTNTDIIFHFEDELLSLESAYFKDLPFKSDRFYLNTLLIGGGLSQQLGKRSFFNFLILWALDDSGYGVYSNPELRMTFIF